MNDPTAYDERRRLAVLITDSRNALAEGPPGPDRGSRTSLAIHLGRLEALLHMLCDSAEAAHRHHGADSGAGS